MNNSLWPPAERPESEKPKDEKPKNHQEILAALTTLASRSSILANRLDNIVATIYEHVPESIEKGPENPAAGAGFYNDALEGCRVADIRLNRIETLIARLEDF